MKYAVITEMVRADLCIGCGPCTAICPLETLKMNWNRYGEYTLLVDTGGNEEV